MTQVPRPSTATTPMSKTAAQGAMKLITKQINLSKNVWPHTLRHSYPSCQHEKTQKWLPNVYVV